MDDMIEKGRQGDFAKREATKRAKRLKERGL
jgi:hypothetical protein